MEKPIKEWLKELPEPIRELGIKRMSESDWEPLSSNRLCDALGAAFSWNRTKEGTFFWVCWGEYIEENTDENGVFTDPKDYSGLPMPDGFSLQNEPPEYANQHKTVLTQAIAHSYTPPIWISVQMGFPSNNKKVLVCWSHTPAWEPSQAYYVDGKFYPDRGAAPYFRVTHWMEMPKGVTE